MSPSMSTRRHREAATTLGGDNFATMPNLCKSWRNVLVSAWAKTTRRMRIAIGITVFVMVAAWLSVLPLPKVDRYFPSFSVEFKYQKQATKFNERKVALLIENRPNPILAPLMLHFISVVPPDWRFRFMGSVESVAHINSSAAIREQVAVGKLDLTYIPANMSTGSQEEISRFLTNLWLYETVLAPAEWLLVFQTDSMLCANSKQSLNDYLDYDWVGAPWSPDASYGGNGGLSMRKVSAIVDVLRDQKRIPGTEPEDVWLTTRLGHRRKPKMANGTISLAFSGEQFSGSEEHAISITGPEGGQYTSALEAAKKGEYVKGLDDWRDGFYEPMGYHTGSSGVDLHAMIFGTPEKRKHLWKYCPELKMTLKMDVAKFVPGDCNTNWKRGEEGMWRYGTEIIDGEEFPLLPEGLVAW